jgi:hypothetical protein
MRQTEEESTMILTVTLRVLKRYPGHLPCVLIGALVCLFGLGCQGPPASLRPLYTKEDAKALPQNDLLKGKWTLATEDSPFSETMENPKPGVDFPDITVEISSSSEELSGGYQIEFLANRPIEEFDYLRFTFALVPIGNHLFFDAQAAEAPETKEKPRPHTPHFALEAHWFGTARIEQDFLRFSLPKDTIFSAYAPLPSQDPDSDSSPLYQGIFTGSTMQLREALANSWNNENLVDTDLYFCRPQMDCNLAVVEDQLKAHPMDTQVMDRAADLFLARGDYPRATGLLRKTAAIPSDFGSYHSRLGLALALAGNFSEARQEFTVAASAPKQPDDNCTERLLTYFLEGSFSKAVQTASTCAPGRFGASADPPLLKYFSLLRLGKQKEAEKYLNQVILSFVGNEKEQLLLLEIQGRLQGHNTKLESPAIQRRFEFFDGLQAEAVGNDARAAEIFENSIFGRKDSLLAMVGRNELVAIRKRLLNPQTGAGAKH